MISQRLTPRTTSIIQVYKKRVYYALYSNFKICLESSNYNNYQLKLA